MPVFSQLLGEPLTTISRCLYGSDVVLSLSVALVDVGGAMYRTQNMLHGTTPYTFV